MPLAIYLVTAFGHEGVAKLEHAGMEYLSFVLLLGSLFVISGGIYVQGSLSGTPLVNTGVLGHRRTAGELSSARPAPRWC